MSPLQSTIFVDDIFDYSGQILEKIPFVANVDPLKKAQYRSLEELTDPIKVVIYMGGHEELVDEIIERIEKDRQGPYPLSCA